MRWYVFIDGKVYGPYLPEQLREFLQPETLVQFEGEAEWLKAADVVELRAVLAGAVAAAPEWFVTDASGQTRGPLTRDQLLELVEKRELDPTALIRHKTWTDSVELGKTKLYAKWKDPSVKFDGLSVGDFADAPRVKASGPKPPSRWVLPKGAAPVFAALLLVTAGVAYWSWTSVTNSGPEDQPAVKSCGGLPTGDCASDAKSTCICGLKPLYCGCKEKGICGMKPCKMYREIQNKTPPPSASKGVR